MSVLGTRACRRGLRRPAPAPPVALVLAAVASVQVGSALAKDLFGRVGPTGAVTLRLVLSALVMLVATRPRPTRWSRRGLAAAALFGAVLLAMNWSFYEAASRVPLGVAVTVEFTGPLAVAVAGSRRLLDLLWVALAAGGVALLSGGLGGDVPVAGVLLALLAGAFWATYILVSQRLGQLVPGLGGLAVALAVAAVVILPVGAVRVGTAMVLPGALAAGLAVAVLSSALPYSLELAALRRLPAGVFGVLMSVEPAMAALAAFAVLGETLRPLEVVALVLVSAASGGATLAARPRKRHEGLSSGG